MPSSRCKTTHTCATAGGGVRGGGGRRAGDPPEHGRTVSGTEEEDGENEQWDEEQDDWERGRWVLWGGLDAAKAVLAGHTDVVKWILETSTVGGRNDSATIEAAMMMGNIELATWLMDHHGMDPKAPVALLGAASNGRLESLQWFQDRGLYTLWDEGVLIKAAEAGQLSVVHWIIDRDRNDGDLGNESDPGEYGFGYRPVKHRRQTYLTCLGGEARLAIHAAAINGHLDVAKLQSTFMLMLTSHEMIKKNSERRSNVSGDIVH
ncbi:unnamed protein product [Phytophthora fragariaefolia]|uniref:Unnamed protein product n=1 Tax=Phytophthora fragariaefolia TaxID=1490495 RepID=A0A9W6U4M8_9STRA|nr:unnamed protein product [Phytophthora fragariaefolia]